MKGFCGIDIGSVAIKIALINETGEMIGHSISPSGHRFYQNAMEALSELLGDIGLKAEDIIRTVATGYGRKLLKEADDTISEISANALGAGKTIGHGSAVRTIINIGGQDSKVILLDDQGGVKNFGMNDKCAAGTGRFIEMTAMNMEIDLDDMGRCHLSATGEPVTISSTCSVFAASEIVSLLAEGYDKGDIIAGVHNAVAKRVALLARNCGVEDTVFFDGGGALNPGLKEALEEELMREIVIPPIPQITTALGAAQYALGHV